MSDRPTAQELTNEEAFGNLSPEQRRIFLLKQCEENAKQLAVAQAILERKEK